MRSQRQSFASLLGCACSTPLACARLSSACGAPLTRFTRGRMPRGAQVDVNGIQTTAELIRGLRAAFAHFTREAAPPVGALL
eukprot:6042651-Prymnesium_polylepis.1